MTRKFIKSILILLPFFASSQNSQESLPVYDTIQVYKCTMSIIRHGDSISYKINDKLVTKEEYENINNGLMEAKKCNPCVLKRIDLDGNIDSQGLFYYTCPGKDEKTESTTNTKNGEKLHIHINSCNDGEWLYYSKEGKLIETKYFDHGTEVKTKGKIVQ